MNTQLLLYASFMLIGTFISSVAQVLLKKEASKPHESVLKEYINFRVIIAYQIFFVATFLSIYAYKVVPLSLGVILEATGYIYVTIIGIIIFKEKIYIMKILALLMIICGIVIYATL